MAYITKSITSRQNPTVIRLCSLAKKKYRDAEGLFRFDGLKLLSEAISCGLKIVTLAVREDAYTTVETLFSGYTGEAFELLVMPETVFSKISEEQAPDGVITVAKKLQSVRHIASGESFGLRAGGRIAALEALRDAGNLGTVLRTAAALGLDSVLLSSDCADIYNPKTVRASMGAIFGLDIIIAEDMLQAVAALKAEGRRTVAATLAPDALDVGEIALCPSDCVFIGNEGHGLSEALSSACDVRAILPISVGHGVESLNAAIAAAIFMWEASRGSERSRK